MSNLYSIADLIDKLIIENIKIFNIRERLNSSELSNKDFVSLENKMNILNSNRAIIISFLDEKLTGVILHGEQNKFMRDIKTYHEN